MRTREIIVATMFATSVTLPAVAQTFCQANGNKTSLSFGIKPSLVVHSDGVLDTTFASGQSGGAPGERLFSFQRTIGAILDSAKAPNNETSREALVNTMLASFSLNTGFALNSGAGVLMPLDNRAGESGKLKAKTLLNEANDEGMKPLAVFNRFDLAPTDWNHCGEYRIVYGKKKPEFESRFLLIFEAAVPNPDPAKGEAGCRPITEFWAGLSAFTGDDAAIANRLSAFFYEGKTDPTLAQPDLREPVVNFMNYGGDGTRGQVRGNLFMQQPWQLREWLIQRTFDPANPLAFVVETVKDNPLAELYQDDFNASATARSITGANVLAALTNVHGDFVAALTSDIRDNLMAEETPKHRKLIDNLGRFDLGTGNTVEVDEAKVLIHTIAINNDDKFNEHQSTSQGLEDAPSSLAGRVTRTLLDHVAAMPSPEVNTQTTTVILNRAQAVTCAGCHMTSPKSVVRENPNGTDVVWPDTLGFVHVQEEDRLLSPALEGHFLPVRRYILGQHLCPAAPSEQLMASEALTAETPAVPRRPMRFVDAVVADFFATRRPLEATGAPAASTAERTAPAMAARISQLAPAERNALRQKVRQEIAEARQLERNIPGAFVENRRPH
jgi:hypothetical protein